MSDFRQLEVWRRSVDWTVLVYKATNTWPKDERFGLTSQTRRAAVSVAANIAEGAGRRTAGEFLQFLGIATGSLAEVETLLTISSRLELSPVDEIQPLMDEARRIGRMLSGLTQSVKGR